MSFKQISYELFVNARSVAESTVKNVIMKDAEKEAKTKRLVIVARNTLDQSGAQVSPPKIIAKWENGERTV